MNTSDDTGKERLQNLIGESYRLQWIIGHGGMSTVWLADDLVNDREVAVKVLRPEFSDNSEFLSRFRNEAVAAENIHSDHVVETYNYKEIVDPSDRVFCFIVMEYVRGETLADLLEREKSLPEDIALDVLEQSAHGLSAIHKLSMVHRDIKPGNMLITATGQVKITDFGIAKAAAAAPLTRTGMVVGTAQYVSPEQAQGQEVTPASDIYSLGVVGYEMMAGTRPFTGDSSVSVAIAHINQAPPQMPTSISAKARELIGIALRKDPARRFADGNEMAIAVSAVRLGQRPPQPRTQAITRSAPAPAPTASTVLLGQATRPTTVMPATGTTGVAPQQGYASTVTNQQQKRGSGVAVGILIAALLAVIVGGVVYASTNGIIPGFGTSSSTTKPTTSRTVTQTITPTEEKKSPEIAPKPPTTAKLTTETITQEPAETTPSTSQRVPTTQPTSLLAPTRSTTATTLMDRASKPTSDTGAE